MSRTAAWCEVQDLLRGVAAGDVERVLREALEDAVLERRDLDEEIGDRPSRDRYNEVKEERDDAVREQEQAEAKLEQAEERADEEKKRADEAEAERDDLEAKLTLADAENAKLRQEVADLQEAVRNLVAADGAAVAPAAGSSTATTTRGDAEEADADRAPDTARTRRAVVSLDAWRSKVGYGAKVPIATGEAAKAGAATVVRGVVFGNNKQRASDRYAAACEIDAYPENFDRAERLYKEAIALDPTLAIAHTNLGNIRVRRGDLTGGEKLYRDALRIDPRQPEALYNLGYLRLDGGDPEAAIGNFAAALESNPTFADAWFNLGAAYQQRGKLNIAIDSFRKYLAIEGAGAWADAARQAIRTMGGSVEPKPKAARASSRKTGGAPTR